VLHIPILTHRPFADARFLLVYIECFQLKIESSGTGKPGPTVKIPGVYKASDAGIAFNKWNNPKSYTFPGPAVWNGN